MARGGGTIAGEEGSVADLGEWGIIAALRKRMPASPLTSVGIGDDAAVVAAPSGSVVAAVDMVIEGRHFRRDWSTARDIGVKAAARSLADIAAMGGVSTALLIALAVPASLPARWATDFAEGVAAEATRAGAGVVGGDTARADHITISVTALGDLAGRPPVLRSGARPGDIIAVSGPLGRSAAGLALLTAAADPVSDAMSALVTAHVRPAPRYSAGPEAAGLGATALIDISDGLLADLGHVAAASAVAIDIQTPSLPAAPALHEAARLLMAPPSPARTDAADSWPPTLRPAPFMTTPAAAAREWMLTGGEDHSLVGAFPPGTVLPPAWHVIGGVLPGAGVTVDGIPREGPGGWQHFR